MDSSLIKIEPPTSVTHPGEMVLEYLEFNEWSQSELAHRTGLTPKTISEICNGKGPITPPTALAFERVLRRPAHFWLGLQRQYDEAQARRKDVKAFAGWIDWLKRFPITEMKARGWMPAHSGDLSDVGALLGFLGVSSPSIWSSVWQSADVAYRQTRKFKTSIEAISVWVRAVELASAELNVQFGDFSEQQLRASIEKMRQLTMKRVDVSFGQLQLLCAASGIAVVLVPELSQTGISGCARWMSDKKAIIGLTLRYKTDDQLWFTFFHELGHILLHRRSQTFVLDNADTQITDHIVDPEMQKLEDEAHRFACDILIPPGELSEFIRANILTSDSIFKFSQKIGIGPGLVVGRLQHDRILKHHQGNTFKQKLSYGITQEG